MNILVFIKSLPYSETAVQYGGLLARLTGGALTLLLSTRDEAVRKDADSVLEQAAALLPELSFEHRVSRSKDVDSIWEEIRNGSYDIVVMRARRAIRFRKRLGIKPGRQVAAQSPISVLVVKESTHAPELKRILICSGGKNPANLVIEKGVELARASGASVTLLHVTNPVPSMYTGMEEIEETMSELLQTDTPTARHLRSAAAYMAENDVEASLEIRQGDVTEEILGEAENGDYDLILIGSAEKENRLKEWIMGDVTRNLVNHASCAVLVVR